jgi:signal transduction histidine kinase
MVNRMMKGDFRQKIEVNTNDELQELATAFNLLNSRLMQLRTDDRFVFLGHLSARMAHEIRKPLNIIQLAAQSIIKDYKKKNKYSKIIINEISNADRFIKEILGFTKPENLNLTLYSINDLLESVVEKFNLLAHKQNIKIKLEKPLNLPKFYFDVLQVEQVFSNIITNSLEALSENGEIKIILVNDKNENIIIKFIDTGTGINENILDMVYDPYFTTKKNGTGLGLSICYRILMAHGAKIEIGNDKNKGALVKITFPITIKQSKKQIDN